MQSIADSDLLKNIDRQTFVNLVSSRTDFSKQDINCIADQLEGTWKQVVGSGQQPQAQLLNLLKSATPEELKSNDLGKQLEQLVKLGGTKRQVPTNQSSQSRFKITTLQLWNPKNNRNTSIPPHK